MRPIPLRSVIPASAFASGWAIITVHDLPEYAESGRRVPLTVTVRPNLDLALPEIDALVAFINGN